MDQLELSEQELIRRESLKKLQELNINPYPADEYPVTHYAGDILKITKPTLMHTRMYALPDASWDAELWEVPHLQN